MASLKISRQEAEAENRRLQADAQKLDTDFDNAEKARTEAILRTGEAQVHAVSLRGRVEGLENDRERTREMLLDVQNRISDLVLLLLESGRKRRESTSALTRIADQRLTLERERGAHEQEYLQTRGDARNLLTRVHAVEQELKEARKVAEESSGSHHDAEMAASEARLEVTALCDRIRETFNLELGTCTDLEPFEPQKRGLITAEAQELKRRLDAMGTVNLLALEEYDEQKERLDFLDRQLEDMETAKKTLLETIQKINVTARGQFVETFDKVERNFNELFGLLFQGGEARVSLDDPDNPLESPISVMARPRGKRPVSILQLSGGERALTAIALLFSLYMVKPSPFCILDEIDAPLDDANIGRFLALLERFSDHTQFIIITHNKMTMQATDVLYGVTMASPGISQVVSVRLDQAVAVAEAG
jgi:chromosome segregation protein